MDNRRTRRRAARQQEIIDAAMRRVVADGLDGLTIAGLAADVDAAVGAIYRYFPGKADLLAALQLQAVGTLRGHIEAALGQTAARLALLPPPVAALARLLVALAAWTDLAHAQPALYQLADRSLSDPRRLLSDAQADAVDEALRPILATCCGLLDAAVATGALSEGPADV
ncbi:MAG: AcrR family transcriptional regulator, partial [Myxococcota bacterium]